MTLLKSQGYDVAGVIMKPWSDNRPDSRNVCLIAASSTTEDARRVRQIIDAPHYVMSF